MQYFLVETDDGRTITELPGDCSAAEAAAQLGATLIDPGPYATYEDASDALASLEDEQEQGDFMNLPRTEPIESQEED